MSAALAVFENGNLPLRVLDEDDDAHYEMLARIARQRERELLYGGSGVW